MNTTPLTFKTAFPELHSELAQSDTRPLNVAAQFYGGNIASQTTAQFAEFVQSPDRIVYANVSHLNPGPLVSSALQRVGQYFGVNGNIAMKKAPVTDSGFFFVFGFGAGLHLPMVLEVFNFQELVIIEPNRDLLKQSLSDFDWDGFLKQCSQKNVRVHLISPKTEDDFTISLMKVFWNNTTSWFLDGSFAYMHFYSDELIRLRQILNEKIKVFDKTSGFFEDELVMMRNSLGNFDNTDAKIIPTGLTLSQTKPVLIVASGPSLDNDIDTLKAMADKAIVVSCGSAFSVLHKAGIKPHFHFETENLELVPETFRAWQKNFDFSDTIFVASITVHPDSLNYFDQNILFVRKNASVSNLVAGHLQVVDFSSPVATNAALSVMAVLGGKNFYLFGVDCGLRDEKRHHAKDTLYFEDGNEDIPIETNYDREIPANFGQGTVKSSYLLDASRVSLSLAIRHFGINVFNCSDGARIDWSRAMKSTNINLPASSNFDASALYASLPNIDKDILAMERPNPEQCSAFVTHFSDMLHKQTSVDDPSFRKVASSLKAFFAEHRNRFLPQLAILESTLISLLRLGVFYGNRIVDDSERQKFFSAYLHIITSSIEESIARIKVELC